MNVLVVLSPCCLCCSSSHHGQVKDDAGDFQDARMDQESFRDLISIKL
jgi:hypothetical protein